MHKLGQMVGKRVSQVYRAERKDRAGVQVIFFFLDGSDCRLTSPYSEIEINVFDIDDSSPASAVDYEGFETIEQAVFDEDGAYQKRVTHLYHRLWSKAVGSSDYDKAEWNELGQVLSEAGIRSGIANGEPNRRYV